MSRFALPSDHLGFQKLQVDGLVWVGTNGWVVYSSTLSFPLAILSQSWKVGSSPLAAGLQERTHGCGANDAGNGSATDADVTCWQHVARRELGSQGKQGLEVWKSYVQYQLANRPNRSVPKVTPKIWLFHWRKNMIRSDKPSFFGGSWFSDNTHMDVQQL